MAPKYKQRGYRESESPEKKRDRTERPSEPRPKQQDMLGPRTPRMVGTVMRARCASCGAALAPGTNPESQCPRCKFELHSCKQCVHFDTARQFECTQPIPERVAKKDAKNNCTFYELRMTVEKDMSPVTYATSSTAVAVTSPSRPNDARTAFENLFKK
jgi:hypothetical protein